MFFFSRRYTTTYVFVTLTAIRGEYGGKISTCYDNDCTMARIWACVMAAGWRVHVLWTAYHWYYSYCSTVGQTKLWSVLS